MNQQGMQTTEQGASEAHQQECRAERPTWAFVCEHFGLDESFQYSESEQENYFRLLEQERALPAVDVSSLATGLWLANVEHKEVPGVQSALFACATEPTNDDIFARFSDHADAEELSVVEIVDLSHLIKVDGESRAALDLFVGSLTKAASVVPTAPIAKAPSIFDGMVPWGMNRSPIGPK